MPIALWPRTVHRFFKAHLLYPLVLSSLLALGLWIGRVYLSHHRSLFFLMWNLFLAWIPYLCALWIGSLHARRSGWWQYLLPSALWLLFFPNATYLVTDFYNLNERRPIPLWYDIGLFAVCAWTGLLLAVASLMIMQKLVKQYWGAFASWLFVLVVVALNGLGIYLGRFMRWNSWDVFTDPFAILVDALTPFLHPMAYRQSIAIMIMFSALLLVFYLSVLSFSQRIENRDKDPSRTE